MGVEDAHYLCELCVCVRGQVCGECVCVCVCEGAGVWGVWMRYSMHSGVT